MFMHFPSIQRVRQSINQRISSSTVELVGLATCNADFQPRLLTPECMPNPISRDSKQVPSAIQFNRQKLNSIQNNMPLPGDNVQSKLAPTTSQQSEPAGLIFDCDGTLADTMPLHFISWQTTMNRHGIEFDENRFYSLAGQPTVSIVQRLLAEQSITGNAIAIAAEKETAFLQVLPQVQPIEPVVEIARRYRDSHPMGVGSGSNRDVVLQVLKHIGMEGFFDAVVGAEDTSNHKPEPDVFLEVARLIQIPPERCRVYEDADLGIEAARRAGMSWFDVRDVHTPRRIT